MPKGEMKGKWKSEKWKFLIQRNYSKKACSCEQAYLSLNGDLVQSSLIRQDCWSVLMGGER